MRAGFKIGLIVLGAIVAIEMGVGVWMGQGILHPARRALTQTMIREGGAAFARVGARSAEFIVLAPDGVTLRGWKVHAKPGNGDWVLLFHGVADNRMGTLAYSRFLLAAGYSVVMMDSRAQGVSGGSAATYGWKERWDTRAVVDRLYSEEKVRCLFALGESMGAAIALQSAAVEPRISAVVAESSFSTLREASYDYAGFDISPWLGRTLFWPATWAAVHEMQREGGFPVSEVSPQEAVARRVFPVLLICDGADRTLPCRHTEDIYRRARGPRGIWVVPRAVHTGALGEERTAFEQRVLGFFGEDGVSACRSSQ